MSDHSGRSRNDSLISARIRSGRTKDEIASFVGVHVDTYCKWEQGRLNPSLRHLRKLCAIFHVDPGDLGYK